jgi:hypothetical protein
MPWSEAHWVKYEVIRERSDLSDAEFGLIFPCFRRASGEDAGRHARARY